MLSNGIFSNIQERVLLLLDGASVFLHNEWHLYVRLFISSIYRPIYHDHKYINKFLNGFFAYFSENQDKIGSVMTKRIQIPPKKTGNMFGISIGMWSLAASTVLRPNFAEKFSEKNSPPIDLSIVSDNANMCSSNANFIAANLKHLVCQQKVRGAAKEPRNVDRQMT